MYKSKLIQIFEAIGKEEHHLLNKFISSPVNQSLPVHRQLFEYLRKYYPNLNHPKLAKATVCKKLFPEEPFNIQKLRKAMHGLTSILEEFLIFSYLQKHDQEKNKILITALGERNIYEQFKKRTLSSIQKLAAQNHKDTRVYKNLHELNHQYYDHIGTKKEKRNTAILHESLKQLDFYYLFQRQQLHLTLEWHNKLLGETIDIPTTKEVAKNLEQDPGYLLYRLILQAMNSPAKEEKYYQIELQFQRDIHLIGRKDRLEIIRILLNHHSEQINNGHTSHYGKMLSLYQFGLEQQLMIEKNQIGETTFANIATVGILSEEYDWVEWFIESYQSFLPEGVKTDAIALSLSLLHLNKNNYTKVIDLLINHDFPKPLQILKAKTILLRAYFEQFIIDYSYFELLIAQTQSFEKYVRRNEFVSSRKKTIYLNFILFTRKIANAKLANNLDQSLLSKIEQTKNVLLKPWLIKKIEENL